MKPTVMYEMNPIPFECFNLLMGDQVMLKYLDKIKLMSETASNGQECLDMVFSKEPGYYSLIIVS